MRVKELRHSENTFCLKVLHTPLVARVLKNVLVAQECMHMGIISDKLKTYLVGRERSGA